LGINESTVSKSGIDIKYMINTYLGIKSEEICNLVSTKILQMLQGGETENKPSKEEINQMICDLNDNIIDKL
jgi:macrodomain Ter protein organizer (MatP/YcbG family)